MYNWDFRSQRVSCKAKIFLDAINIEPIIDAGVVFGQDMFEFVPGESKTFSQRLSDTRKVF